MTAAPALTPQQRDTLAALGDVLIPGDRDVPSASAIGAHEELLDRALAARPDLLAPLAALLDRAAGREPRDFVERLFDEDRDAFRVLSLAVSGAYYLDDGARSRVGYPGPRRRSPLPPRDADRDLRGGLLDPVLARGQIYRPTP